MFQRMIKSNSGFSLMELAVVIAIIAIMMGIAVPNFIEYRQRSIIVNTADEVYANLLKAKSWALRNSVNISVIFAPAGDNYTIFTPDGPQVYQMPPGIIVGNDFGIPLLFSNRGVLAPGSGVGNIWVNRAGGDNRNAVFIGINLLGRLDYL